MAIVVQGADVASGVRKTPEEQFNCRRLPGRSVRQVHRPRWVAYHVGDRRIVGLLVPRPIRQDPYGGSFLRLEDDGTVFESRIGYSTTTGTSTLTWYSARASELPREQWQAIRAFYRNLPPSE